MPPESLELKVLMQILWRGWNSSRMNVESSLGSRESSTLFPCFSVIIINNFIVSRFLDNGVLIISYPCSVHEVLVTTMQRVSKDVEAASKHKKGSLLTFMGNTDLPFTNNGIKTPDFTIYEMPKSSNDEVKMHPTVVFETGYSQPGTELGQIAAMILCRTSVQLVVTVDIPYTSKKRRDPSNDISEVIVNYWEITSKTTSERWKYSLNKPLPVPVGPNDNPEFAFAAQFTERTGFAVTCVGRTGHFKVNGFFYNFITSFYYF